MTKPIRSSIYANSGMNVNFRQFHSYAEFTSLLGGKEDIRNIILMYLINNVEFLMIKITAGRDNWQVTNIANNDPWFTFTCGTRDRVNILNIFEQELWKKLGV
jgi:hypothetical protein